MLQRTFTGHVTPEDKARSDYLYVPFELPEPARRLTVRYHYSRHMHHGQVEGGNVIDIGLFGPRGNEFPGAAGFRGWSGSDRLTFTIETDEATPGYLPGPLPAGKYHVALGLYRICPDGADYEVEIEAEAGPQTADHRPQEVDTKEPAVRRLPSAVWLKGDLQSHTFHSDGKGSPQQLVEKARALGLDFLAITDHNTISHHQDLDRLSDDELLLIPGQEVTTYYGHMNVWGARCWCDFRAQGDADMAAIIERAHEHGGLCSINHPKKGGPPWNYSTDLPVDAMEVWQGPWPNRNEESLALWDSLLRDGRRLPAVGGSDYHCPRAEETGFLRLGQPTTWVEVHERSVDGILSAIAAGRACISASPHGPRLSLQARTALETAEMGQALAAKGQPLQLTITVLGGAGFDLHLITEAGIVARRPVQGEGETITLDVTAHRYVRAELVGDMTPDRLPPNSPDIPQGLDLRGWRWALSNPIYVI